MLTKTTQRLAVAVLLFVFVGFIPLTASALSVESIPSDEVVGDFVVGPGKLEVFLNPGEQETVELVVTNRTGQDKVFRVNTEDFVGSRNVQETVILLGDERGPYSLKDYVKPEETSFTLKHAERARLPVTVSVPADAEPGGLYGSVLVDIVSDPADQDAQGGAAGGAAIISRIGVLLFVRVPGEAVEDGVLKEFGIAGGKSVLTSTPVNFHVLFENNGSVHLNPYGGIKITNALGEIVGEREVEPWFVLPDSLRLRELEWDRPLLLGRYTAAVEINRGYDDIVDVKEVSFWVLPVRVIAGAIALIVLVVILIYLVKSRFEIRRKRDE